MAGGKRDDARSAYASKDFSRAVALYSELIDEAESEDNELHVYFSNRAACYQQLGRNREALSDAESCVANKPSFIKGHTRLATIMSTLGRHRDAAHAWERVLQMEPGNASIRGSLDGARRRAGMPSYSGGGDEAGGFDFSGFSNLMTGGIGKVLSQAMGALANASMQEKAGVGVAFLLVLWTAYKWIYGWLFAPSINYSGGYDDYDDYGYHGGYGGGYGSYSRGLSWPVWIAIMGGAYYVPPMFPQVFGQYAAPFFGMSWTTFMWLLRMVTSGGGGGLGSFGLGGLGGRRRGRGYF